MTQRKAMDMYGLLPGIHRLRDSEHGLALKGFLGIVSGQAEVLREDIDRLYDNMFIETCDEWVVPYIGDLVGNNPIHEVVQRRRTDVANTIRYRRGKGTLPTLEQIAHDVTDWHAHTVNFFELLGWTQNLNHLRMGIAPNPRGRDPSSVVRVGSVNVRCRDALDRLNGPFDEISHNVDVRRMCHFRGWHNIRNVGIFLWRLRNYPMRDVRARRLTTGRDEYRYHFSPLGNPMPLFIKPVPQNLDAGTSSEINVNGPIRPMAFHNDLESNRAEYIKDNPIPQSLYYGDDLSLAIKIVRRNGEVFEIPASSILASNLGDWERPPAEIPVKNSSGQSIPVTIDAAVDVCRGRIAFAERMAPKAGDKVLVSYNYGFSADMGGGPYPRQQEMAAFEGKVIEVAGRDGGTSLEDALDGWWQGLPKPQAIIRLIDNGQYSLNHDLDVELPEGASLAIEAADRTRPNLRLGKNGEYHIMVKPSDNGDGNLLLDGLLVEGGLSITGAPTVDIVHCTFVPGRGIKRGGKPKYPDMPSVSIQSEMDHPTISISKSIVGPIRLHEECGLLSLRDSIVDVPDKDERERAAIAWDDGCTKPGPKTCIKRSTIFGPIYVRELVLASESILLGRVDVDRVQRGCVRYSYLPQGSKTPDAYRCQPGWALQGARDIATRANLEGRIRPAFTSTRYGHPAYAQLSVFCAREILTGAEDGSEMGAFSSLKQPQRLTNLNIRLKEYLPFGRDGGPFFVT